MMHFLFPKKRYPQIIMLMMAFFLLWIPACSLATQTVLSDIHYDVSFSIAHQYSPDAVAWLYQPNSTINQPVPFHEDPYYYWNRQFEGRINTNGSIYMYGDVSPDFTDNVLTLYGKNNLDYSLFGSLSEYKADDYYASNPVFYLITPDAQYQLDVFAGIQTTHADEDGWRVSAEMLSADFDATLTAVLDQSFITPHVDALPQQEDDWMILTTMSSNNQGTRYVIYARKRQMEYTLNAPVVQLNHIDMDERSTQNGMVTAENVGSWMTYAQNDPLWSDLVFEVQTSRRWRPFGDGGCGPTSIAIALANLLEKDELLLLANYALSAKGYTFCTCSVNEYWCDQTHVSYHPQTAEEYHRYLPLLIANFATGNNTFEVVGRGEYGTNMEYLPEICSIFDLTYQQTSDIDEVIRFLQQPDHIAIACTTGSPFTSGSHFLVLCGVDEEYLYVIDSLRRDDYTKTDPQEILEVITPGLVRLTFEEAYQCKITPVYLLERATHSDSE